MESYGPLHKFWGPLPGFIYSFVIVVLVRPIEVAAIVMASAEYIVELVYSFICIEDPDNIEIVKKLIAIIELSSV